VQALCQSALSWLVVSAWPILVACFSNKKERNVRYSLITYTCCLLPWPRCCFKASCLTITVRPELIVLQLERDPLLLTKQRRQCPGCFGNSHGHLVLWSPRKAYRSCMKMGPIIYHIIKLHHHDCHRGFPWLCSCTHPYHVWPLAEEQVLWMTSIHICWMHEIVYWERIGPLKG